MASNNDWLYLRETRGITVEMVKQIHARGETVHNIIQNKLWGRKLLQEFMRAHKEATHFVHIYKEVTYLTQFYFSIV